MKELFDKYVGKKGVINWGGFKVYVEVDDVKVSYGKERFHVKPVAGEGAVWVEHVDLI